MERYICIHGHFYQPPRENPWLEAIEWQDSAYPYHDWNERIADECYEPNAASRILNAEGQIVRIVNNYANISFNFGPTLLTWLESKRPDVYQAVLEADRQSRERFSGHGSAMAQAYNHMILPLANSRDRLTQVIWGIQDFVSRFQRPPEGLWLPETAVDEPTLEVLAETGIRYTVLAPYQAARVRRIGTTTWQPVGLGGIDPSMPYLVRCPRSGRSLSVFFYDGPISQAVAFEGILADGENFAQRLLDGFSPERAWPQLVHIATDGETYGHHHRHGDMALAYALHVIASRNLAHITNYGEHLDRYPPTHEVEIAPQTSWSCAHGLERWQSDCGCQSGQHPGWRQAWRRPLREALDWLRDTVSPRFEEWGSRYLRDPWAARNDYIHVILDRSPDSLQRFFQTHQTRTLNADERTAVLKLMELQRHAMLMYTSCGWFFDDISGIETVQVIQYAGRVIQLAQDLFGAPFEEPVLAILAQAQSNVPEARDGAHIYEIFVRPAMVDLLKVGAHAAIAGLFQSHPDQSRIYCYDVKGQDGITLTAGLTRLALGYLSVTSTLTGESLVMTYGMLHWGDHNVSGGVRPYRGEKAYRAMVDGATEAFNHADLAAVIRVLDQEFEGTTFTINQLFRDEQRAILSQVLSSTLAEAEASYRQIFEHHASLMRFLKDAGFPLPQAFRTAAELVLSQGLKRALADDELDPDRLASLLDEIRRWEIVLDPVDFVYALEQNLARLADRLRREAYHLPFLEHLVTTMRAVETLPFTPDLRRLQNVYYQLAQKPAPDDWSPDADVRRAWQTLFTTLGQKLHIDGSP